MYYHTYKVLPISKFSNNISINNKLLYGEYINTNTNINTNMNTNTNDINSSVYSNNFGINEDYEENTLADTKIDENN